MKDKINETHRILAPLNPPNAHCVYIFGKDMLYITQQISIPIM